MSFEITQRLVVATNGVVGAGMIGVGSFNLPRLIQTYLICVVYLFQLSGTNSI